MCMFLNSFLPCFHWQSQQTRCSRYRRDIHTVLLVLPHGTLQRFISELHTSCTTKKFKQNNFLVRHIDENRVGGVRSRAHLATRHWLTQFWRQLWKKTCKTHQSEKIWKAHYQSEFMNFITCFTSKVTVLYKYVSKDCLFLSFYKPFFSPLSFSLINFPILSRRERGSARRVVFF